ncbi:MAG TPA: AMP-binding protein, partial [Planococcus sp. (in: firmicutes)]|nr:AMP-binding protein [Planococcus sp. (in: firmicutes)]
MTYPNWLSQRAHLSGDRMALSYGSQQWTFSELNGIALNYAGRLAAAGIGKDSRVAFLSKSHPQFVMLMYACMHVGCEMVMLNERLSKVELAYQIKDSEADIVLVDDALQSKIDGSLQMLFSELEKKNGLNFTPETEWPSDRTISIMYTSGTTGSPKGVRQTAENHFSSSVSSALNIGVAPDDVWLCAVPLFHISGFSILMRSLIYGIGVRLHSKFDSEQCAYELQDGLATHMSVVGVTLERILATLKELDLEVSPRFKVMLAGGGAIPTDYIHRAGSFGMSVLQTYGMTETSSQTTTLQPDDADRKVGSSGKPLFLYQLRIGGALKPGDIGEIHIRG